VFPLRDANPRHGPSYVTWLLITLNVLIFIYMFSLTPLETERFIFVYSFVPQVFFGDPLLGGYRLLSSMFLHGGLAHILGNMFFLYVFGDNVEERLGHGRYLLFYLAGGVMATLAHGAFMPSSPVPLVGASGAVSAILGAYIVLFPRQRVLTFIPPFFIFWLPAWLYLGYWALIQVVEAVGGLVVVAGDGVAWWAHVGGFFFGAAVVRVLAKPPRAGLETASRPGDR
jgi:membrane associated rhomboid family serine protease